MNQSRAMRYVGYSVTAILMIALAVAVLFAACFVSETEKKVAFWSTVAIVAICATPHFRRRLREQCSIFFLLVTAYIILAGASTLYAYAPKFALSEFSRLLAAYAVFLLVFSFAKKETFPNVAAILCGATSLLSLIHLDAASAGLFSHDIMRKFQTWTSGYFNDISGNLSYGYNANAGRLYGLFGNANSMATMCAIGIFLALYLLLRAKGPRRLLPCAVLIINTVTFLMCISLGATMSLGITVLLVVLCARGAHARLSILLVTLETLFVAGVAAILSFSHVGLNVPDGYLVLVYCAIGWLALFGLDWLLRPRVIEFLCKKIKILCIGIVALLLLLAAACAVLFTQTAPVTLQDGDGVNKRFFPGTGTCAITIQMDGPAEVQITSTTQAEILQETATTLYNDTYDGTITLEIPDNAIELQMSIRPVEGTSVTVQSISYTGTQKSGQLAAGYRFLPPQIAIRLQSLTTNHSATQRVVFMQDGLKMWKQTPVFGRGLGGFENGLASVQNFFYETKYAHNYYVQVLCDLGLVGLLLFVSMLAFALQTLLSLRKKEEQEIQALYPALLGAVLMYAIHGGLEISASVAETSIFVFGTFGLVAHAASAPASLKNHGKVVAWSGSIVLGLLAAAYAFLLYQNARAAEIVNQETITTSQLKQCVEMDVFEGDDFRLTYAVAAMSIQDEEVYQQADIYADELQAGNSNAVGPYLTEYFLQRGYYEKAAAASEKFLRYTRSNIESWNGQFSIFENAMLNGAALEQMEQIAQLALDTYQAFQAVQAQQTDELALNAQSVSFLTRLRSTEGSLDWRVTSLLYDSYYAPDTNGDGCVDNVELLAGDVIWGDNGALTIESNSAIRYCIAPMRSGVFTLTVETKDPKNVSAVLVGYEPEITYTENSITLQVIIPEEKLSETIDLRLTCSAATDILRVSGELNKN